MSATDVNVSFKPLGAQMRNVKCLACGIWGHSRGDRECQVTGWDPFSAASRPVSSSSIRPSKGEEPSARRVTRDDAGDSRRSPQSEGDSSSSNASSSSGGDIGRKRKRKHRSKSKKRGEKESHRRRRSRKHRSGSPSRRSHEKKRPSRHDDD